MAGTGRRIWMLVAMIAACGDDGERQESAAKAVDTPAAVAPAADAEPVIARVDETRRVARTGALLELAFDVADGTYRGKLTKNGVRLDVVPTGSTLEQLGARPGDVIESVGGVPLRTSEDLRAAWRAAQGPGVIAASVVRGAEHVDLRIFLAEMLGGDAVMKEPAASGDAIDAAVVTALARGVRKTGQEAYEIDPKIVALLVAEMGLVEEHLAPRYRDPNGLTVTADAPLAALGLTRWDVVTAVGVTQVRTGPDVQRAFAELGEQRELTISVVRVRDPLVLRYRVVEGILDAPPTEAIDRWREREDERRAELERLRAASADADAFSDDLAKHVTKIDDEHYEIDQAFVDLVLADPALIARGARVVPSLKNGRADGFKLYAIRPNSAFARVGFQNGDTIHSVNGQSVDSPDRALDVYQRVKRARRLTFEITRRGKPHQLVLKLR